MRRTFCLSIVTLALIFFAGKFGKYTPQDEQFDRHNEPLDYYSKQGPLGQFFRTLKNDLRLKKVGVVGLRNGELAAYSKPGQHWTFYEHGDIIKKIAEEPQRFRFLRDAKGKIRLIGGDARSLLEKSNDKYGVIIVEAYWEKGIPVAFLTREAIATYRKRLAVDGIMLFHITRQGVDLESVLANVADDAKCVAYFCRHTPSEKETKLGIKRSTWLVMAAKKKDLVPLFQSESWQIAKPNKNSSVWTDDFVNLLEALRIREPDD